MERETVRSEWRGDGIVMYGEGITEGKVEEERKRMSVGKGGTTKGKGEPECGEGSGWGDKRGWEGGVSGCLLVKGGEESEESRAERVAVGDKWVGRRNFRTCVSKGRRGDRRESDLTKGLQIFTQQRWIKTAGLHHWLGRKERSGA